MTLRHAGATLAWTIARHDATPANDHPARVTLPAARRGSALDMTLRHAGATLAWTVARHDATPANDHPARVTPPAARRGSALDTTPRHAGATLAWTVARHVATLAAGLDTRIPWHDAPAAQDLRDERCRMKASLSGFEGGLPDTYGMAPDDLVALLYY